MEVKKEGNIGTTGVDTSDEVVMPCRTRQTSKMKWRSAVELWHGQGTTILYSRCPFSHLKLPHGLAIPRPVSLPLSFLLGIPLIRSTSTPPAPCATAATATRYCSGLPQTLVFHYGGRSCDGGVFELFDERRVYDVFDFLHRGLRERDAGRALRRGRRGR